VLRLQPLKGADPIRSLRHALKQQLRDYGLRCLSVQAEARDEAHIQEYAMSREVVAERREWEASHANDPPR
jgi:hypothetical protein